MIQRIQTIYLFLAAALMATVPFFRLIRNPSSMSLYGMAVSSAVPWLSITVLLLVLLAVLLPLITIFLYKKRRLQITLCYVVAVVIVGSCGMITYFIGQVDFPVLIAMIASILFLTAARRAIKKDENLVRSLDRIR